MSKQLWLVIEENQFTKETLKEYFKSSEIELYIISEKQIQVALLNNTFKIVLMSYQYMQTPTLISYFKDHRLPTVLYDAKEEDRLEGFKKQHLDKIFYGQIHYASLLNTSHQLIKSYAHKENKILYFKDIVLDVTKIELKINQQIISINEKECSILELLMLHPYQSFTTTRIRQQLFSGNIYMDDSYLKKMMENLMLKINIQKQYITNMWQTGYKMVID